MFKEKVKSILAILTTPLPNLEGNKIKTLNAFITGFYMYVEASGQTFGDVSTIKSPRIASNGNTTCMVFYYHMYGQSIHTLRVKVGDQVLWELSSNQGNDWHKATLPLYFNDTYRVR